MQRCLARYLIDPLSFIADCSSQRVARQHEFCISSRDNGYVEYRPLNTTPETTNLIRFRCFGSVLPSIQCGHDITGMVPPT
jgi:hypothetical protein